MKNRMTLVDVLAEVADLRKRILGMRVVNVYDVDGERTFLIKFGESGKEKQILLIESGIRIHTTRYARDKPLIPGGFAMKLRKHLRGRRLTKLTQVGIDRVVDCTFGSGNATYHLIIELYDKGNIILTDKDYNILSLLRSYTLDVGGGTTASAFTTTNVGKKDETTNEATALSLENDNHKDDNTTTNTKNNKGTNKHTKGNTKFPGSSKSSSIGTNDPTTNTSMIDTQKVRIAVKQKYLFATDAILLRTVILGPDPDEIILTDDNQTITKENEDINMDIVDDIPPVNTTNNTESTSNTSSRSGSTSTVPTATPEPTPTTLPFSIDVTHSIDNLVQSLTTYLKQYEETKLASMPNKLKKKITLATALVSRGSGLDVFGPLLVEHAIVKSGLVPDCKIDTLYTLSSTPTAIVYDTTKILNLAKELRYLPSILRTIANPSQLSIPAYAIVESKLKINNQTNNIQQQQNIQELMKKLTLASSSSPSTNIPSSPSAITTIQGCLGTWEEIQTKTKAALSAANTPKPTNDTVVIDATKSLSSHAALPPKVPTGNTLDEDNEGVGSGQVPPSIPYTMTDFIPQLFAQYGNTDSTSSSDTTTPSPYIIFPSFDTLCDEYFSQLDIARAEKTEAAVRTAAEKRLDRVKEGHLASVTALQSAFHDSYRHGRMIEDYADIVDAACLVIRSALEHSVNWIELENLVLFEANNQNPIASRIAAMDLANGKITLAIRDKEKAELGWKKYRQEQRLLQLANNPDDDTFDNDIDENEEYNDEYDDNQWEFEESSDEEDEKTTANKKKKNKPKSIPNKSTISKIKKSSNSTVGKPEYFTLDEGKQKFGKFIDLIEVNVFVSAAANAREYYAQGKAAKEKEERTMAAAEIAIRKAEKTVADANTKQINDVSSLRAIKIARKPHWFERFYWCITSEGLIVVAGRNAQDNEQLVKRYLRPQDAYIHADIHGAATVILRNRSDDPNSGNTLPALSLSQAGSFCVCLSSAWSAHATTAAWWVPAAAVSKTAPTGEYLPTGSFMIRGKKNFLPPVKLELGVVLLWKIDDTCIDNHIYDRKIRGIDSTTPTSTANNSNTSSAETSLSITLPNTTTTATTEEVGGFIIQSPSSVSNVSGEDTTGIVTESIVTQDNNDEEDESEENTDDDDDDNNDDEEEGNETNENDNTNDVVLQTSNIGATAIPVTYPITAHVRRQAKKLMAKDASLNQDEALRIAAETEALKKQTNNTSNDDNNDEDASNNNTSSNANKPKIIEPKRGQKSKLKKLKEKYIDQDDEDREIALAALGHKKKVVEPPVVPATNTVNKQSSSSTNKKNSAGNNNKSKDTNKSKQNTNTNTNYDDEDNNEKLSSELEARNVIAALVSIPRTDDILTHAVPMLCPWQIALTYKYRAKLSPGSLKKGKTAQSVLHQWLLLAKNQQYSTPREADLIKSLVENEVIGAVVGGCKVSAGGGLEVKKK